MPCPLPQSTGSHLWNRSVEDKLCTCALWQSSESLAEEGPSAAVAVGVRFRRHGGAPFSARDEIALPVGAAIYFVMKIQTAKDVVTAAK